MASTAPGFLSLPLEIRLEIYSLVFGHGKVVIEAETEDESGCMIPQKSRFENHVARSSQLLRVNRTILSEARAVLYSNTVFHVLSRAFAGKLPIRLSNGHSFAPHIRHLVWQLDCDMLKRFYPEEFELDAEEAGRWSSLEIRCRAETWRDSFLGEWCDREAFVMGRDQVLRYARIFHSAMSAQVGMRVSFVEDRSQLGRGRVILRVSNSPFSPGKEGCCLGESQVIAVS